MKKSRSDLPIDSPVPFYAGSNGEYSPPARTRMDAIADARYRNLVDEGARRLGVSRRDFVTSACGTAAALLVINQTYGCGSKGGKYDVDKTQTVDKDAACARLAGD